MNKGETSMLVMYVGVDVLSPPLFPRSRYVFLSFSPLGPAPQ